MRLEWDERKNAANLEKHGYDFREVRELLDGARLVLPDNRKEYGETRYITIGYIGARMAVAVYTERPGVIRIISFRKANSREKERFEKYFKDRLGTD